MACVDLDQIPGASSATDDLSLADAPGASPAISASTSAGQTLLLVADAQEPGQQEQEQQAAPPAAGQDLWPSFPPLPAVPAVPVRRKCQSLLDKVYEDSLLLFGRLRAEDMP